MRDPVADGLRNWMLIKLLIYKGYSEASPVTWDCLEIYGMERRCRLTYETSAEYNFGPRQCRRLLREWEFRYHKPRPVIARSDPLKQAAHKKTPPLGQR